MAATSSESTTTSSGHPKIDPTDFSNRLAAGKPPLASADLLSLINNPTAFSAFYDTLRDDREVALEQANEQETGVSQTIDEFQAEEAIISNLKALGNDAFGREEWKKAYIAYEAGVRRTNGADPVFKLNRAAAALKLKLFDQALTDTQDVIYADFNVSKALFRRAQAQQLLGDWTSASRTIEIALGMVPTDEKVLAEKAEIERLMALDHAAVNAWLEDPQRRPCAVHEMFGEGELDGSVAVLTQQAEDPITPEA
ncbi:hypothetical protein BKA62DRAFT_715600 [Auriculariales sp. MPI-PUGE-AT-0066]|nr:hypothetical protein BKA62DRAFT_715600 [Auriculariales sp. MPI-PUGE-AT-0066]